MVDEWGSLAPPSTRVIARHAAPATMALFMAGAVVTFSSKCRNHSESMRSAIRWTSGAVQHTSSGSVNVCLWLKGQQTVYLSSKQESVLAGPEGRVETLVS